MTQHRVQKLRLIDVIRRLKEEIGSYDKMAEAIEKASGIRFDRRKLRDLVAGEDVSLRIRELRALDIYLAPRGEGLAAKPIFEQAAILAEIARCGQVAFVLGSLPRKTLRRDDISQWDVRAMIEGLRNLYHYGQVQVDIEEVVYREDGKKSARAIRDETWLELITGSRASLVCLASPRVNRATEVMLGEMFGVAPFKTLAEEDPAVPFRFIWPKDRKGFVSTFEYQGTTVAERDSGFWEKILSADSDVMGLTLEDRLLTVYRGKSNRVTYGIVAAQRRSTGRIWLVISGLDGASTFGAASAAWEMVDAIPPSDRGENSAVLWALVETSVETDKTSRGDQRIVKSHRLVDAPRIHQPS